MLPRMDKCKVKHQWKMNSPAWEISWKSTPKTCRLESTTPSDRLAVSRNYEYPCRTIILHLHLHLHLHSPSHSHSYIVHMSYTHSYTNARVIHAYTHICTGSVEYQYLGVQGCDVSGCGVSKYDVQTPSPISALGVKSPDLQFWGSNNCYVQTPHPQTPRPWTPEIPIMSPTANIYTYTPII